MKYVKLIAAVNHPHALEDEAIREDYYWDILYNELFYIPVYLDEDGEEVAGDVFIVEERPIYGEIRPIDTMKKRWTTSEDLSSNITMAQVE